MANASAAAYLFQRRRQGLQAFEEYKDPDFEPSRLFLYYAARTARQPIMVNGQLQYVINDKTNTGTYTRLAMKTLEQLDVCAEATWPYGDKANQLWVTNVDKYPGAQAFQEASSHKTVEYARLDDKKPPSTWSTMSNPEKDAVGDKTLNQLKACLSEGHPVVLGFKLFGKVNDIFDKTSPDGVFKLKPLPGDRRHIGPPLNNETNPPSSFGAHAVLAIGYDDAKKCVLIQNSWGSWWSKDRYFWMGYEWITDWDATDDFWMLNFLHRK